MEYIVVGLVILFVIAAFTFKDTETVSGPRDPMDADRSEWGINGKRPY